ncbi:hypothetical protein ILUMI_03565 [Ignelater luminosus]|uniref:Uncharacterized protein n=1 Tax=Ignelater luminosus TaxID=2038154 RepID=A0A8K0DAR6_IGNLU|nr:hypothetical protein ILUMI_03565 [Ignelater luminosus]
MSSLTEEQLRRRAQLTNLPREVRQRRQEVAGMVNKRAEEPSYPYGMRKRCYVCKKDMVARKGSLDTYGRNPRRVRKCLNHPTLETTLLLELVGKGTETCATLFYKFVLILNVKLSDIGDSYTLSKVAFLGCH